MSDDLELDLDIRSVAVTWSEDDEPVVSWAGCSAYEAWGLLRAGLRRLAKDCSARSQDDEDADEA